MATRLTSPISPTPSRLRITDTCALLRVEKCIVHFSRDSFASDRRAWPWFEQSVTYANARLSQALILAGKSLGRQAMLDVGLTSLAWLMELQTGPRGVFSPIGTDGFNVRGEERHLFDQQPVEAAGSISACLSAHRATGDRRWLGEARRGFQWFFGENTVGQRRHRPHWGCRATSGARSTELARLRMSSKMRLAKRP